MMSRSKEVGKVLSVGCGLGAMEHYIRAQNPLLGCG
jgi:hypothetical protein